MKRVFIKIFKPTIWKTLAAILLLQFTGAVGISYGLQVLWPCLILNIPSGLYLGLLTVMAEETVKKS